MSESVEERLLIEPVLPCLMGEPDRIDFLSGAQILEVGTAEREDKQLLAIRYVAGSVERVALFGFSELGLWLVPEQIGR